ncbi:MAG: PAS domain-containing protein [Pseudomonadota bacterium]
MKAAPESLVSRTLWRVLPAIVVVQLVIGWLAWSAMHQLVSNELHDRLHRQAEQYAQLIAFKLDTVIGTATSVAENDLIVNGIMDAQGRDQYMPVFFETAQVPGLSDAEMTLADYKGRRIASNRPDVDYTEAPWLNAVLGGETWHQVENQGFIVAAPVMIADHGEGVIVIRYGSVQLAKLLTIPTRVDAISIFAEDARPLYSSNAAFSGAGSSAREAGPVWAVISTAVPGFDGLLLLVAERRAKALAAINRLGWFLGATMVLSISAVVIAIGATAVIGTRPVLGFIDNVERITRTGDLDQTISSGGTKEFHRLSEAFNRMLTALRTTTASRDELQRINQALDQANERLEESETRFQLAVEGSSVGIWDWDARTDTFFWSDRMKALIGVSDETFTPDLRSFQERLHPDDYDRVMESRRRHLAGEGDYDNECRLRKEDGSYMWLHIRGQAVWDEAGNVVRLAGSSEDISERKADMLRLDRYARELERSNRELDDFAHIASHDLKEPLRAISNHARFLREDYQGKLEQDGENRLNRLIKLSRRMEQLIADLLYFSRLGRSEEANEPVDLNLVIADIEVSLADMMRQRNARLVMPLPLASVIAGRHQMATVLQNLITNAIKYNDSEEKVVEIGVASSDRHERSDDATVFYVRDNGIGIEEAFKEDIFRIFKRLNNEKAYGEGTGAGLTFVKKIIESRNGGIWLESTPGEGTTFFFTLNGQAA